MKYENPILPFLFTKLLVFKINNNFKKEVETTRNNRKQESLLIDLTEKKIE